jgi:outer membrane protein assembly factor BamA
VCLLSFTSLYGDTGLELDGIKGLSFDNYNRVDGLPISYGMHGGSESFDVYIRTIYRLASERVGWKGGLTLNLSKRRHIDLAFTTYSYSDTNDGWRVGDFENSLSSFLFKEDFRNYYQRQGVSFSVLGDLGTFLRGRAEYRYDRYSNLKTVAELSLFGWDKEFRPNPPITEGWMGSVEFEMTLDTRNDREDPTIGWYQSLIYEISDPTFGGTFDFQYSELTILRYNRMGSGKNLDMRLFATLGSSTAPPQRGINVYGVGGLRGFPDNFEPQYRGFIASIEGRFTLAERFRKSPLYRDQIRFLLFADMGGVKEKDSDRGMEVDGDFGIGLEGSGIITYSGLFLAFGVDDGEILTRLTFRVKKEF